MLLHVPIIYHHIPSNGFVLLRGFVASLSGSKYALIEYRSGDLIIIPIDDFNAQYDRIVPLTERT